MPSRMFIGSSAVPIIVKPPRYETVILNERTLGGTTGSDFPASRSAALSKWS